MQVKMKRSRIPQCKLSKSVKFFVLLLTVKSNTLSCVQCQLVELRVQENATSIFSDIFRHAFIVVFENCYKLSVRVID